MDRLIVAGRGIYSRCHKCGSLVKLNKWIFGDLHICLSDEEIKAKRNKDSGGNNGS